MDMPRIAKLEALIVNTDRLRGSVHDRAPEDTLDELLTVLRGYLVAQLYREI